MPNDEQVDPTEEERNATFQERINRKAEKEVDEDAKHVEELRTNYLKRTGRTELRP